jgi:hypothetical protein
MPAVKQTSFVTWVAHGIRRGRFEWDRRKARWAIAAVLAVALIASTYLLVASHTAVQGRRIEQLRADLLRLEAENEQLEEQIARESAVSRLMERAARLGYVPVGAGQVEYLSILAGSSAQP